MMRWIIMLLAIALASPTAWAEIKIDARAVRAIDGTTTPAIVGGRVLDYGTDEIKVTPAAVITIESPHKYHLVRARKLVTIAGQTFVSGESVPVTKLDTAYIVAGDGRLRITVIASDPGLEEAETEIVLGPTPQPDPGPGPGPTPTPTPTPNDIPNAYNVGQLSLSKSPPDATLARTMAQWYREAGMRLYGTPTLATIDQVLKDIANKFAAKQCRDQPTCQAWAAWKQSIDTAMIAEQRRRGRFSREDWYACLIEIATALEAVR